MCIDSMTKLLRFVLELGCNKCRSGNNLFKNSLFYNTNLQVNMLLMWFIFGVLICYKRAKMYAVNIKKDKNMLKVSKNKQKETLWTWEGVKKE